jgi:hypothetical protein
LRTIVDFHCPCGEKDPEKYGNTTNRGIIYKIKYVCLKCTSKERSKSNEKYRKQNKDKIKKGMRDYLLKKEYNITSEEYDQKLKEQGFICACCGEDWFGDRADINWPVDHNHKTNKNRDIICPSCNKMLGFAKDDISILEAGIAYLERHGIERGN